MSTRAGRAQLALVIATLVLLHFYVRPRIFDPRLGPDFLLFALVVFAMRSGPGAAAVAGFMVGLVADAMTPARFGASALAHTVVGYAAAWGRAVFFLDNLLVTAGFVAVGVWLRDFIVLVASGADARQLLIGLGVYSPLRGIITAAAGALVLFCFRQWFAVRLDA
ncbi:MAG TPA: rod shape-determining protein MreD [Gemmatimonadales bacterium]|nr:rod shape-determining protein MreD [Gemmatimonadales bacterium]